MKCSMTGQETCDLLIQVTAYKLVEVTAWAGLIIYIHVLKQTLK